MQSHPRAMLGNAHNRFSAAMPSSKILPKSRVRMAFMNPPFYWLIINRIKNSYPRRGQRIDNSCCWDSNNHRSKSCRLPGRRTLLPFRAKRWLQSRPLLRTWVHFATHPLYHSSPVLG